MNILGTTPTLKNQQEQKKPFSLNVYIGKHLNMSQPIPIKINEQLKSVRRKAMKNNKINIEISTSLEHALEINWLLRFIYLQLLI